MPLVKKNPINDIGLKKTAVLKDIYTTWISHDLVENDLDVWLGGD